MRSHPTCKCCLCLLRDTPDGVYCRMCYDDLHREVKEFWFAVGSVSDAAREELAKGECPVRQVSEEPSIFLVCLYHRGEWHNYETDLVVKSDGTIQVQSLKLYLLRRNGGNYGNVAETRLETILEDMNLLQSEDYQINESEFVLSDEFDDINGDQSQSKYRPTEEPLEGNVFDFENLYINSEPQLRQASDEEQEEGENWYLEEEGFVPSLYNNPKHDWYEDSWSEDDWDEDSDENASDWDFSPPF